MCRMTFGRFSCLILLAMPAYAQQMPDGVQPQGPPPLPHPEIPPPPPLTEHVSAWLVIVVLVLIGLVFSGIVMLLFGRKKPGPAVARRPVKDALRALKELRNQADVMSPAQVGHQVSETLRRFYEARYGIPALVRTSQELFPKVDLKQEPLRRRVWRERYEPLAAIYDALSYAPAPATKAEAVRLIDEAIAKLEEERMNEDSLAS